MDPAAAKQQIAERVKQANNFLVTVNANPTVDQLAACIGLTLLLSKMGKHATAVFSGQVPNVIEFLEPEKVLQKNTDALRDFIISLDKNKADKLRYKVEDNVVKIFITPYRTSISQNDLVFSDGDYNVEVVLALGVVQRSQLDAAITAHGRILHDATVISVNTGAGKSPDVGQINWKDPAASSLSEMLVSISEAFGPGLIDAQNATAFLTGIVAETQRFSNKKTTPKVMTMSAQLMAAGANQQLIVSKLEPPPPPPPAAPPQVPKSPPPKPLPPKPEGIMDVPHDEPKGENKSIELGTTEIHIDEQGNLKTADQLGPDSLPDMSPPPPPPPEPAPPPAGPPPEEQHHALMSAPPLSSAAAVEALEDKPNWSTPYNLSPQAPYDNTESQDPAQSEPKDEVAHGKDIQPPADMVPPPPVDQARGAVESALSAGPFDPATAGPVEALNAQPMDTQPLHVDDVTPPPPSPPPSDTPSLILPVAPQAPISTTPTPPPPPPPPPEAETVAPPPVPPPLMVTPGSVITAPSQQ